MDSPGLEKHYINKHKDISIIIDQEKQEATLVSKIENGKPNLEPENARSREDNTPKTYDEAWNHPDPVKRDKWCEAILDELIEIQRNGVWEVLDMSKAKAICLKWVFKIKPDGRYKERIVALGYKQIMGLGYDQTNSPVMSDTGLRIIISLSLKNGWKMIKLDVKNAFLKAEINDLIYIVLPKGWSEATGDNLSKIAVLKGVVWP